MSNLYNTLTKHGTAIGFGLGILGVLIFFLPIIMGMEAFSAIPEEEQAKSDEGNIFLTGIYFTIFLAILALVIAIIFGIIQVASNPKSAKSGLIAIVALVAIFGIAFALSNEDLAAKYLEDAEYDANGTVAKNVGMGIRGTVTLLALAFFGLLVSEIRNFFK